MSESVTFPVVTNQRAESAGRMSATVVVPQSFMDDMTIYLNMANPFWTLRVPTWEERLRAAIEERAIRNRVRRFRDKWADRLSMAGDVLRGEHYCVEDD